MFVKQKKNPKVITMELQGDLLIWQSKLTLSICYKQKLTVDNVTLRNLNNDHVRLYVLSGMKLVEDNCK